MIDSNFDEKISTNVQNQENTKIQNKMENENKIHKNSFKKGKRNENKAHEIEQTNAESLKNTLSPKQNGETKSSFDNTSGKKKSSKKEDDFIKTEKIVDDKMTITSEKNAISNENESTIELKQKDEIDKSEFLNLSLNLEKSVEEPIKTSSFSYKLDDIYESNPVFNNPEDNIRFAVIQNPLFDNKTDELIEKDETEINQKSNLNDDFSNVEKLENKTVENENKNECQLQEEENNKNIDVNEKDEKEADSESKKFDVTINENMNENSSNQENSQKENEMNENNTLSTNNTQNQLESLTDNIEKTKFLSDIAKKCEIEKSTEQITLPIEDLTKNVINSENIASTFEDKTEINNEEAEKMSGRISFTTITTINDRSPGIRFVEKELINEKIEEIENEEVLISNFNENEHQNQKKNENMIEKDEKEKCEELNDKIIDLKNIDEAPFQTNFDKKPEEEEEKPKDSSNNSDFICIQADCENISNTDEIKVIPVNQTHLKLTLQDDKNTDDFYNITDSLEHNYSDFQQLEESITIRANYSLDQSNTLKISQTKKDDNSSELEKTHEIFNSEDKNQQNLKNNIENDESRKEKTTSNVDHENKNEKQESLSIEEVDKNKFKTIENDIFKESAPESAKKVISEQIFEIVASLKVQGDDHYKANNFQTAINCYQQSLKVLFNNTDLSQNAKNEITVYIKIMANISSCLMKQNRFEESILYNKKVLEFDPSYIKSYYRIGQAYKELKKFDDSLKILKEGLPIAKSSSDVEMKRSYILLYNELVQICNCSIVEMQDQLKVLYHKKEKSQKSDYGENNKNESDIGNVSKVNAFALSRKVVFNCLVAGVLAGSIYVAAKKNKKAIFGFGTTLIGSFFTQNFSSNMSKTIVVSLVLSLNVILFKIKFLKE